MNKGVLSAFAGYFLWGLLPIYWKLLGDVPALEILAHRMAWSLLFLLLLLGVQANWSWIGAVVRNRRVLLSFTLAAVLLSINWGVYIWSVTHGFIVETSLGYFINPLVNVLLGVMLLGERLRRWQLVALASAMIGVGYLTWSYGRLPTIALTLAFSFAFYGLIKSRARLPAIEGLSVETALLFPLAFGYLVWLQLGGNAAYLGGNLMTTLLLTFAGVSTAVPLLLFAYGAQRVTLTTLGILQYFAPTIQFVLGVFVYKETFAIGQLIGFVFIWVALIIYTTESLLRYRRQMQPKATVAAKAT